MRFVDNLIESNTGEANRMRRYSPFSRSPDGGRNGLNRTAGYSCFLLIKLHNNWKHGTKGILFNFEETDVL